MHKRWRLRLAKQGCKKFASRARQAMSVTCGVVACPSRVEPLLPSVVATDPLSCRCLVFLHCGVRRRVVCWFLDLRCGAPCCLVFVVIASSCDTSVQCVVVSLVLLVERSL